MAAAPGYRPGGNVGSGCYISAMTLSGRSGEGAPAQDPEPQQVRITVDGPFSLAAAAAFGFGPNTGRPRPDEHLMRLAFVTDDMEHQAGAVVRQQQDGTLLAEISGVRDTPAAVSQLRRILSVDRPVDGWLEAGRKDPVLGALQARHAGLRPVLFHSPYEAAAWGIIAQRRHRAQAAALRVRLSAELGRPFELAGQTEYAFPLPERLRELDSFPGMEPARVARLRGVAERALRHQLDPARIIALETGQALAGLQAVPGIGPVYAGLILLRSTGVTDALTLGEPRLPSYLRHYYSLPEIPGDEEIRRLAEPWRPFRTWAGVLIRVAGDADELPWEAGPREGARRPGRARSSSR
jgi:DNA-3-methyladenine glycosylase II